MTDTPITIKRIRSSRSLKMRLRPDGEVVVTAHPLVPQRTIDAFVEEHLEWLEEKRQGLIAAKAALTEDREQIYFRGRQYQFRLQVKTGAKKVTCDNQDITVTAPEENHIVVREILEKWYRKQATEYFTARVPLLADLMGHTVKRVTIRDQRSRWGSCSSRLTISLNWRLIQAPDWVSDYVVYHELAHLKHMNHSQKFWDLVEAYVPRYRDAEKWLKDHHQLLHF